MRVLHVSAINNTIFLFRRNLIRHLKEEGWEVHLAFKTVHQERTKVLENEGYIIHELGIKRERLSLMNIFSSIRELRGIMLSNNIEVVHSHTPIGGLIGRIAARLSNVEYVLHTTGGWYFHENMSFFKRKLYAGIERKLATITDWIFSVNKEDIETAKDVRIVPRNEIVYSGPAGVEANKFLSLDDFDSTALRRKLLGKDVDKFVVGIIGRLVWEKGYKEYIDVIAQLNQTSEDYIGVAIGLGPQEDEIRSYAEKKGVLDKIKFIGYRDDVPHVLRCFDLFLFPSHREGVPVGVQEAMISLVPVVVFDIRGCRELVNNLSNGFVVSFGDINGLLDCVSMIKQDSALARTLAIQARSTIMRDYLQEYHVERQKSVYKSISANLNA